MSAKILINQIQTTLEGGTLAQRFINEMRRTYKEAPEAVRDRLGKAVLFASMNQKPPSLRW